MIERLNWGGLNADGTADTLVGPFLRQLDRPGSLVIWWFEPDMGGTCDLLVSRELTTDSPLRVRPGQSIVLAGDWLRVIR